MNGRRTINQVTGTVLGAAIDVHRALGPGLLESAYQRCLCYELELRKLPFARELSLPVRYKEMDVDAAYRVDLLVGGRVVVEIKAVQHVLPIHTAQLITYLKLGNWPVGLLINFNVELLKNGVTRIANNYTGPLPSLPEDAQRIFLIPLQKDYRPTAEARRARSFAVKLRRVPPRNSALSAVILQ